MSGEGNAIGNAGKGKKRKYLPHGRPVKKGGYPLRPGVQGFFLTCDGGRERQATNEAINILDSYYEEIMFKKDSGAGTRSVANITKPLNKKIKFKDSDSDSSSDEGEREEEITVQKSEENGEIAEKEIAETNVQKSEEKCEIVEKEIGETNIQNSEEKGEIARGEIAEKRSEEIEREQTKKQKVENNNKNNNDNNYDEDKPIDELIKEELREMSNKKKRKFLGLETTCNGIIFVQMQKKEEDPSPVDIVQYLMNSAFNTRKHMSRFILRMIPIEIICYASEEEITRAIKPIIQKYFPENSSTPKKFAVQYGARANTGIDRNKIINAVAKSVPNPHKVDLNNPDKTIVVEIVKTNCLIGVVERYKELSKFNLRQLTSPQQ